MKNLQHDGMSSKWLSFHELDVPERKTKVFEVRNKVSDDFLGTLEFRGKWRQYVFMPAAKCLFNCGCLSDISKFLEKLTCEWKEKFVKDLRKGADCSDPDMFMCSGCRRPLPNVIRSEGNVDKCRMCMGE